MFPPSTLANVYVKGSLKNTDDGFEFALKNTIDSTMLSGIGPVVVGDKRYAGAALTLTSGGKQWQADQVKWTNLVPAHVGLPMQVRVQGDPLPAGKATVAVTVTSTDVGTLTFEFSDTI